MTPLLRVRDLRTTFATAAGTVRAVDGVSFDVLPGETLGLVGESGCGKTVTALSILRLLADTATIASESRIEFDGRDLTKLSERDLRDVRGAQIAMIFQEPTTSLNPVLSVGTQIVEAIRAHRAVDRKQARARAIELLELVGLPDPTHRVDAYPHELSGGMQQRVMIAMALSCEPKILIADEPTTALDVTVQAQILELLATLKRKLGMAMILITHDIGVVAGLADRIAVMYGGLIVEEAAASVVLSDPRHPYTIALLESIPRMDRRGTRLPVIPGSVPRATAWPSGCRFHPRCRHAWERCRADTPPLDALRAEHHMRCWLGDEPERRTT